MSSRSPGASLLKLPKSQYPQVIIFPLTVVDLDKFDVAMIIKYHPSNQSRVEPQREEGESHKSLQEMPEHRRAECGESGEEDRVPYLKSIGVRDNRIKRVLVRFPKILAHSVENKLKPTIALLSNAGHNIGRFLIKKMAASRVRMPINPQRSQIIQPCVLVKKHYKLFQMPSMLSSILWIWRNKKMINTKSSPPRDECIALIKSCRRLKMFTQLSRFSCKTGSSIGDVFLLGLLVQMYGNVGSVGESKAVFDSIPGKDFYSWNLMLASYARNGHITEAKSLFDCMPRRNLVSWTTLLNLFGCTGLLMEGKDLYDRFPAWDVVSMTSMLTAYAGNGCVQRANFLFDSMKERNLVCWNCMLDAFSQEGKLQRLRNSLRGFQNETCFP